MENINEIETLKNVLDLELFIKDKSKTLSRLKNQRFRKEPDEPVRGTISIDYPEIKSEIKFNWPLALLPSLLFLPWFFIYYFVIYKKDKEADIEAIKNSDAYKSQCQAIDKRVAERQAALDLEYKNNVNEYNNVIIPQYNHDLEAWTKKREEEITVVSNELSDAEKKLCDCYNSTKILPVQYRNISAIEYIYDMISTSNYDIKQAIDLYDRNEQRKIDEQRLEEQRLLNEQQQRANQLAATQASLLEEQNDIAEKARRDANKAAVVGAVQRHNINKKL
ncbi:MAG: hypothetical protein GX051_06180 [Clostridiales bacterium]|nr:hypothetical protein [Clostridiales bacterium]